jgi:predicted nucleic acid-binding protein
VNDLNLKLLPPDSDVFIDSTIFTYHLLGHKKYRKSVKDFLIKIESGIINGYINEVVISEVYHNVLRVKICDKFKISPTEFVRFIKSNPQTISEVDLDMVAAVLSMKSIQLIQKIKISAVGDCITKYNLLSADAIHAASCKIHGIEDIATNDTDFERVPFLKLWVP